MTDIKPAPRKPRTPRPRVCPKCGQVHSNLGVASAWDAAWVDDYRFTTVAPTSSSTKGGSAR